MTDRKVLILGGSSALLNELVLTHGLFSLNVKYDLFYGSNNSLYNSFEFEKLGCSTIKNFSEIESKTYDIIINLWHSKAVDYRVFEKVLSFNGTFVHYRSVSEVVGSLSSIPKVKTTAYGISKNRDHLSLKNIFGNRYHEVMLGLVTGTYINVWHNSLIAQSETSNGLCILPSLPSSRTVLESPSDLIYKHLSNIVLGLPNEISSILCCATPCIEFFRARNLSVSFEETQKRLNFSNVDQSYANFSAKTKSMIKKILPAGIFQKIKDRNIGAKFINSSPVSFSGEAQFLLIFGKEVLEELTQK